jgi:hypothetical protein
MLIILLLQIPEISKTLGLSDQLSNHALAILMSIIVWHLILISVTVYFLYLSPEPNSSIPPYLSLYSRLKLWFHYLAFPLWMLVSVNMKSFYWVTRYGAVEIIPFLLFCNNYLRNFLPSACPLSVISRRREPTWYFILLSSMAVNQTLQYKLTNHFDLITRIIITVIIIGGIIVMYNKRIFWNDKVQMYYCANVFALVAVQVCLLATRTESLGKVEFIAVGMAVSFGCKLASIYEWRSLINCFSAYHGENSDSNLTIHHSGLFMFDRLLHEFKEYDCRPKIRALVMKVLFRVCKENSQSLLETISVSALPALILDEVLRFSPDPGLEGVNIQSSIQSLANFPLHDPIMMYQSTLTTSASVLSSSSLLWQLKAHILTIKNNVYTLHLLVKRLQSELGNYWGEQFELSILVLIIEYRFEQIFLCPRVPSNSRRLTYPELFSDLRTGLDLHRKEVKDFRCVLEFKRNITLVASKIVNYLFAKSQFFEDIETQKIRSTADCMDGHRKLHELTVEIEDGFKSLERGEEVPSIELTHKLTYYFSVKQNIAKSRVIFKELSTRLTMLYFQGTIEDTHLQNLSKDSIIMKVGVTKADLGMILDFTPDIGDFLGAASTEEIRNTNINTLFPGPLAAEHEILMRTKDNFSILSSSKRFFLNGFDGELRDINFMVKLAYCNSEGPCAYTLMKTRSKKNSSIVIIDTEFKIISAEKLFWDVMDSCSPDPNFTMEDLCSNVCQSIKLYRFMTNSRYMMRDTFNSGPAHLQWKHQAKEKYLKLMSKPIRYRINKNSSFYSKLKNVPLIASFEECKFGSLVFYKLQVSFDFNNHKEARKFKRNQVDYVAASVEQSPINNQDIKQKLLKGVNLSASNTTSGERTINSNYSLKRFYLSDAFEGNDNDIYPIKFLSVLAQLRKSIPKEAIAELLNDLENIPYKDELHWLNNQFEIIDNLLKQRSETRLESRELDFRNEHKRSSIMEFDAIQSAIDDSPRKIDLIESSFRFDQSESPKNKTVNHPQDIRSSPLCTTVVLKPLVNNENSEMLHSELAPIEEIIASSICSELPASPQKSPKGNPNKNYNFPLPSLSTPLSTLRQNSTLHPENKSPFDRAATKKIFKVERVEKVENASKQQGQTINFPEEIANVLPQRKSSSPHSFSVVEKNSRGKIQQETEEHVTVVWMPDKNEDNGVSHEMFNATAHQSPKSNSYSKLSISGLKSKEREELRKVRERNRRARNKTDKSLAKSQGLSTIKQEGESIYKINSLETIHQQRNSIDWKKYTRLTSKLRSPQGYGVTKIATEIAAFMKWSIRPTSMQTLNGENQTSVQTVSKNRAKLSTNSKHLHTLVHLVNVDSLYLAQ